MDNMERRLVWLEATRPKTLTAALCPVILGSSLAYHKGLFEWVPASICLLFALLVQIGTNFANDYLDGVKGTDTDARIGPRRAVASGLVAAGSMKAATVTVLGLAFILGLSLIPFGGWWLLLVGISSVACAWLYTGGPYPLAYNGLGDVFVVFFFGFVAVGCTYFVQAGAISVDAMLLGLACGLLVNNILIVNNYRDVDEDAKANKRTLVVLLGKRWAIAQYALSVCVAGCVPLWLFVVDGNPYVLLGCAVLVPGAFQLRALLQAQSAEDFQKSLKGTSLIVLSYGALVSIGLIAGSQF